MKLNIEITADYINLFDINTQIVYNQIPLAELENTIIINNKLHSYWIEKYFNHMFIRKTHMYKLAQFINVEYPKNKINWFSQFYKIEYYQMLLYNEYNRTGNSETFNRDLFEVNEDYFFACVNELAGNQKEIAKIKGEVFTQLITYNLL